MQILPDYNFPYLIDSVNGPVIPRHCWYFNAMEHDFQLGAIRWLEETAGQAVKVRINGLEFFVPASWHLLVVDDESQYVDMVPITQCSNSAFKAFLFHPLSNNYEMSEVTLLDLSQSELCIHVDIPRGMAMCHPVGPRGKTDMTYSCLLSPQDLGKYLVGTTAKELLL